MLLVIGILSLIVGLVSLGCWIFIVIKMFKNEEGPVQGIIGIVTCGIWAFIWGWMKHKEYDLSKIMYIWTAAWVVSLILNIVQRAMAS